MKTFIEVSPESILYITLEGKKKNVTGFTICLVNVFNQQTIS